MAEGTSFWEYVRRAFHARVRLGPLGRISLNKWLLAGAAILGIGFPPAWLLAAGLEILYLYTLSMDRRFRSVVDAERLEAARVPWEETVTALQAQLEPEDRKRFSTLTSRCRDIQRMADAGGAPVPTIEEAKRSGMDQLLYMYLKLLVSRTTLLRNFSESERGKLRAEIERIGKDLGEGKVPETVRKSREGTLEIQKRRLENLDRAAEQRAVIESELDRIEKQVELIREDTAMGREPVALSSRIDQVVSTLGETSEWMRKNADLLGDVGEDKPRGVPVFLDPRTGGRGGALKEGG